MLRELIAFQFVKAQVHDGLKRVDDKIMTEFLLVQKLNLSYYNIQSNDSTSLCLCTTAGSTATSAKPDLLCRLGDDC